MVATPSESTCSGWKSTPAFGSAVEVATGFFSAPVCGLPVAASWAMATVAVRQNAAPANRIFRSKMMSPE